MKKNKKTVVSDALDKLESVALDAEDAGVLRLNEQNVLQAKLRLADIELTIANLNDEKASLFSTIKSQHEEFVANARKFAAKNGINPDGEPAEGQWNLDTSTMVFNKLK
jgi:hypothetical protein